jgi:hypothetical protein
VLSKAAGACGGVLSLSVTLARRHGVCRFKTWAEFFNITNAWMAKISPFFTPSILFNEARREILINLAIQVYCNGNAVLGRHARSVVHMACFGTY